MPGTEMPLLDYIRTFLPFGPAGLIAVIWYLDRKDFRVIMDRYASDMAEQREMYASNVRLVENYAKMANDLHGIVVINTQAMQRLVDSINTNQFCPLTRMVKRTSPTDAEHDIPG